MNFTAATGFGSAVNRPTMMPITTHQQQRGAAAAAAARSNKHITQILALSLLRWQHRGGQTTTATAASYYRTSNEHALYIFRVLVLIFELNGIQQINAVGRFGGSCV